MYYIICDNQKHWSKCSSKRTNTQWL